jgi:hypothetical protein
VVKEKEERCKKLWGSNEERDERGRRGRKEERRATPLFDSEPS